jgi:hypothetical protein
MERCGETRWQAAIPIEDRSPRATGSGYLSLPEAT